MTRLDLLNRVITAAVPVALAVTLGVWWNRAPLAAGPPTAPVQFAPEPTLAPPPAPIEPATMPTVIQVPVEVEIAPATELAAAPAEANSDVRPAYRPRRRGLFQRRSPT